MSAGHPLGIDVGGSGIKGAPVDLEAGDFAQKRLRIDTPEVSTPEAVCDVIAQVVDHFDEVRGDSPIGVTIPGVVQHGVVKTAANIDKAWIGCHIEELLEERLQHDVVVVNDADAAGVGELTFGAAKGHEGLVVLTTLGTGIGTAIFNEGVLVPNSELGHLEIDGHDAETRAASSAKTREGLSYPQWAERLQRYYRVLEDLLWPDLFVVGGGVSKDSEEFLPLLDIRTPIVPATLKNRAGIIGAAVLATASQRRRGRHTG
ncbi:ROK family protein [Phycicoccus endophyticus]|uniref:ROK family protein n=1 Tax=Phycicoccus endophyticus TaxID=1690220 RepID=A0A7G9R421_9MICO|nr:ROK family protein [Phycicoccus endophyticus]NHI18186.1 ROK family protein [Phycicoccus endophyticus]QNN50346.1 ROK family protein [Phycicoccus endophyticus]GGL25785.1 polyphosphate glucokinase [Phycicoccus endophyticus]